MMTFSTHPDGPKGGRILSQVVKCRETNLDDTATAISLPSPIRYNPIPAAQCLPESLLGHKRRLTIRIPGKMTSETLILIPGRTSQQGKTMNEGQRTTDSTDEINTQFACPDDMRRPGLAEARVS